MLFDWHKRKRKWRKPPRWGNIPKAQESLKKKLIVPLIFLYVWVFFFIFWGCFLCCAQSQLSCMEAVNSGNEIPCCFQVLMKIFFPWVSVKLKPCYFATNLFSKMEKGTCRNKAFVIKMVFCPIVYFQLHFKKKKKRTIFQDMGGGG